MKDNKTTKLPSKLAKKLDDFMYYQNALESLKEGAANAECIVNKLENDILAEMANCDPSVFNCLLRKNIAAGISDGMIFKVSTRSSITRVDGKSETDDKWLRSLPSAFVRTKLSLNKQAIEAAMSPDAENHLTASEMRKLGIARENAQSLKVYDEPSHDTLRRLMHCVELSGILSFDYDSDKNKKCWDTSFAVSARLTGLDSPIMKSKNTVLRGASDGIGGMQF